MHGDWNPARVKHIPLHPPRDGTPGEGIYLGLWREWAEANPREWFCIFTSAGPVRQRAASVAASFMVYMGCNGGRSFTQEAMALAKTDTWRERAFLRAWAMHNTRSVGVNHGLRTIEYMLARQHPIAAGTFNNHVNWPAVPVVTMDDIDIVESMVRWWASTTASVMREIAEPTINAAVRKIQSGIFGPPLAAAHTGSAAE